MSVEASCLYIVGTPIGNLGDITARAVETLQQVDVVYAEDTRVTRKLLDRYEIKTALHSYREAVSPYQMEKVLAEVIAKLEEGQSLAYVSDAGTPGVSDPGNYLVSAVVKAGFTVVPIPGPSALASLISVSGFSLQRPLFVGFLPKKKGHQTLMGKLRKGLEEEIYDTLVFYESPKRIVKLLQELAGWNLSLEVCLGRELTKMYEEVMRGPLPEVLRDLEGRATIKGEITLLVYLS